MSVHDNDSERNHDLVCRAYNLTKERSEHLKRFVTQEKERAEAAEAKAETLVERVDQLLRFINVVGMADQYKAFCVKEEASK